MSQPARRLLAIRHAKAEPYGDRPDHERPLTTRGVADAEALGDWLKEHNIIPDFVWCSTATRTRQTWAGIVDSTAAGALVDHDQRIYNASVDSLLEVLRETPGRARTVAIVGHAPGIPALVSTLTEGSQSVSEVDIPGLFVTAAAAVLRTDVPWKQLAAGVADLEASHVGRSD